MNRTTEPAKPRAKVGELTAGPASCLFVCLFALALRQGNVLDNYFTITTEGFVSVLWLSAGKREQTKDCKMSRAN